MADGVPFLIMKWAGPGFHRDALFRRARFQIWCGNEHDTFQNWWGNTMWTDARSALSAPILRCSYAPICVPNLVRKWGISLTVFSRFSYLMEDSAVKQTAIKALLKPSWSYWRCTYNEVRTIFKILQKILLSNIIDLVLIIIQYIVQLCLLSVQCPCQIA